MATIRILHANGDVDEFEVDEDDARFLTSVVHDKAFAGRHIPKGES